MSDFIDCLIEGLRIMHSDIKYILVFYGTFLIIPLCCFISDFVDSRRK